MLRIAGIAAWAVLTLAPVPARAADEPASANELHISWQAEPVAVPAGRGAVRGAVRHRDLLRDHRFSILERRRLRRVARERRPQLGADRIVVTGVDEDGRERSRAILLDPRIVRAEHPGVDGELSGTVLFRPDADFLISVPDDLGIRSLQIHQPRWTGEEFVLDLVGVVPVE